MNLNDLMATIATFTDEQVYLLREALNNKYGYAGTDISYSPRAMREEAQAFLSNPPYFFSDDSVEAKAMKWMATEATEAELKGIGEWVVLDEAEQDRFRQNVLNAAVYFFEKWER